MGASPWRGSARLELHMHVVQEGGGGGERRDKMKQVGARDRAGVR